MSILPKVDFVLVYDATDLAHAQTRAAFEKAMRKTGLILHSESADKDVYVTIYCPFDLLAVEAENVKLEMPLKNCPIYPDDPNCLSSISKHFETDDEVDFVSGPFERDKMHLFEGHEDQDTFFRSALRSFLVYHMLICLTYDEELSAATVHGRQMKSLTKTKRRGLPYLLIKGVYKDAYILHDQSIDDPIYLRLKEKAPAQYTAVAEKLKSFHDPRRDLNRSWTRFRKFQPLWKVRNYFGEKIAFYFAWVGTYVTSLWVPAIVGLCDFLYGIYVTVESGVFGGCNCPCNNTTSFTSANVTCGVQALEMSDIADAVLHAVEASFNNKFSFGFALLICLWGTIFLETWKRKNSTLAYEWDVNSYQDSEPDRPEFFGTQHMLDPVTKELIWVYPSNLRLQRFAVSSVVVVGMMMLVFGSIASVITFQVVMSRTWNCKQPVTSDEDMVCNRCLLKNEGSGNGMVCFVIASILPAIMNAISVLVLDYLYSKVAVKLTNWENHQTQSDYNDALILKLFVFQFVNSYAYLVYTIVFRSDITGIQTNGLWGMGAAYRDSCSKMCMSYLALQVLALMIAKPTLKAADDMFVPWCTRQLRKAFVWMKSYSRKNDVVGISLPARRNSDGEQEPIGTTFLERERRRPPLGDFCLGEFSEKVIQFGYVVMFTISFPLAPFIALIVSLIDLRLDAHRLLWFNRRPIAFIAPDIGLWKSILQFLNFCGIVCNSFLVATSSEFTKGMSGEKRLITMLAFEHVVFFCMYLVQIIIPEAPARVKQAMRRERYQVGKLLSEGYLPQRTMSHHGGRVVTGANAATPSPISKFRRRPSLTMGISNQSRSKPRSLYVRPTCSRPIDRMTISPARSSGPDTHSHNAIDLNVGSAPSINRPLVQQDDVFL